MSNNKYVAFISYRHKKCDISVAVKTQKLIESYLVPKDMREKRGAKILGRVFRDETELPLSQNLSDEIYEALDKSEFLVVVCTPDTPHSLWVKREIEYFLEHHDRDHIIAILAHGTPDESFPPILTSMQKDGCEVKLEPLAAKLTDVDNKYDRRQFKREIVRIYAAILGCEFDQLWQRERRAKTQKALQFMFVNHKVSHALI